MYFAVSEDKHILHLRFHAPDSGNALSLAAARELAGIGKQYAKWPGVVAVSSGHPTLFCSGGNLSDYAKMKGKAPGLKVNREITRCLEAFSKWSAVKLALIEGDVLGGGMEWLARFDYRWSTPYALFSFWQKRIGLSPGWGGGTAWSARIGESRMRGLLLEARLLGPDRALALGLVDRLVAPVRLQLVLADWCAAMSSEVNPALGRWSARQEAAIFTSLWQGPEHKRALARWKK